MNIETKKDFETSFTGWFFIIAAVMLFAGWLLSPHQINEYLVATDFEAIEQNFWYWVWMFRVYIFGWVIMGGAIIAFAYLTKRGPFGIVILPGAGILTVGTFTMALAFAFYYSYGAWGIGQTEGKSPDEINAFMEGVTVVNQYATCLVRFGKVFSGAGLLLIGFGLFKFKVMDSWIGIYTMVLGMAAMGIVMLIPDNFEIYKPLFHIKILWLVVMGVMLLKKGINVSQEQ